MFFLPGFSTCCAERQTHIPHKMARLASIIGKILSLAPVMLQIQCLADVLASCFYT